MDLGSLTKQAKKLVDQRGGVDALKGDAEELKDIAEGAGARRTRPRRPRMRSRSPAGSRRRAKRQPRPEHAPAQRKTPRSAARAANQPHMPCTPPPGGVEDEHRKIRGSGVAYGAGRSAGRARSWRRSASAAVDVAADVVRVLGLDLRRPHRVPRHDHVAEARGEPLDLALDRLGHVGVGAVRDVAVGPQRVRALRGARSVEEALLGDEHVGPPGSAAGGDVGLRLRRARAACRRRAPCPPGGTPPPPTAPARSSA